MLQMMKIGYFLLVVVEYVLSLVSRFYRPFVNDFSTMAFFFTCQLRKVSLVVMLKMNKVSDNQAVISLHFCLAPFDDIDQFKNLE